MRSQCAWPGLYRARARLGYAQEAADAPGGGGDVSAVVIEPWPAGYQCALLCRGGWAHRVERGAPWRPVRARLSQPYPAS